MKDKIGYQQRLIFTCSLYLDSYCHIYQHRWIHSFNCKHANFLLLSYLQQHQMDPTSNFNTYRQSLKAAMQRALSAQEGACDKIVIPFFSLLVKDFYFLNEGCSSKMPNGYINFQKFWQLAKQVTEFIQWKQVDCPYPRDRQALNYLLTAPVFSENCKWLFLYPIYNLFTIMRHIIFYITCMTAVISEHVLWHNVL